MFMHWKVGHQTKVKSIDLEIYEPRICYSPQE